MSEMNPNNGKEKRDRGLDYFNNFWFWINTNFGFLLTALFANINTSLPDQKKKKKRKLKEDSIWE